LHLFQIFYYYNSQGELINQDLSETKESTKLAITQLDATVDHIHDLYETLHAKEVAKPWLPPLEPQILTPFELKDATKERIDLTIAIGLVDVPEEQAQVGYQLNIQKEGNIIYLASSGYGKTVFLTTLLLSLAKKNSPKNLNFYLLDFGNSGLIPLNKLHHTADYIIFDDTERMTKLKIILEAEIQKRKKLLASKMVQNFEVYNQVAEEPIKAIIVAVDNFDVVKELGYETEEFFMRISRDGFGLGIYLITTATRTNGIKYATLNNFKNKIAGYLFDENDAVQIVGRSSYKQSEIKGRTLIKMNSMVSVMQIYVMTTFENEIDYNKGIDQLIEELNQMYPTLKAPRIPVLPETLTYLEMKEYQRPEDDKPEGQNQSDIIYLGLDKESVELCGIDPRVALFTILGEAAKGKTNILHTILEQIIGRGELYLFDSKNMELYGYKERKQVHYVEGQEGIDDFIEDLTNEIETRKEEVLEKLAANPRKKPKDIGKELEPFYIVVDDWDNFIEVTKTKATKLLPLLTETATVGITIIITGHSGKLKGFDEMTKFVKTATEGLLLGSAGSTNMFSVSQKEIPRFGDGLLFANGNYRRLRLPKNSEEEMIK